MARRTRRQPVFVRHPPVINHPPEAWHHRVPYPYRFKIDGPWLFILGLAIWGLLFFQPCLLLAIFIAFLRCWIWMCFRFPVTMMCVNSFINGMLSKRRY